MLFILGSVYLYLHKSDNAILIVYILWVTFIAILWYSKETYWLKQVQQKQFNLDRDKTELDRKNYKLMNTIELIQEFNEKISEDMIYVISKEFFNDFLDVVFSDRSNPGEFSSDILKRKTHALDRVCGYFEKTGLMLKSDLISFDLFFENMSIMFPKLYNNVNIQKIISGSIKTHKSSWKEMIVLKGLFEKRLT